MHEADALGNPLCGTPLREAEGRTDVIIAQFGSGIGTCGHCANQVRGHQPEQVRTCPDHWLALRRDGTCPVCADER